MAAGDITIKTRIAPLLTVVGSLGDPPRVTGGYGGWEIVDRPRRVGITQWMGREPLQMDINMVLDGYIGSDTVEFDITKLERMALPHGNRHPPTIDLRGSAVPYADADLPWLINRLEWGDAIRLKNGDRVRQFVTIGFLVYVAADRLQLKAAQLTRQTAGRK